MRRQSEMKRKKNLNHFFVIFDAFRYIRTASCGCRANVLSEGTKTRYIGILKVKYLSWLISFDATLWGSALSHYYYYWLHISSIFSSSAMLADFPLFALLLN